MTFTCYEPEGMASVMSTDLVSGRFTNEWPKVFSPAARTRPVEAGRQVETLGGKGGFRQIDIWKRRLGSGGKDFVRMTHFNDYA